MLEAPKCNVKERKTQGKDNCECRGVVRVMIRNFIQSDLDRSEGDVFFVRLEGGEVKITISQKSFCDVLLETY